VRILPFFLLKLLALVRTECGELIVIRSVLFAARSPVLSAMSSSIAVVSHTDHRKGNKFFKDGECAILLDEANCEVAVTSGSGRMFSDGTVLTNIVLENEMVRPSNSSECSIRIRFYIYIYILVGDQIIPWAKKE